MRTENWYDTSGHLQKQASAQYMEAVRGDGSTVWRGSAPKVQQRKLAFANGDYVLTNEALGRKSTYPKRNPGPVTPRSAVMSCVQMDTKLTEVVGARESVGGYQTAQVITVSGKNKTTNWYALDYGCAKLRVRWEYETGVSEQNLVALIMGEPDPALFQIPATFQEVPPSRVNDLCADPGSGCQPAVPLPLLMKIDQNYANVNDRAAKKP
jgi:hypothetical protein